MNDIADLAAHLTASRILVIDDNQAIHQDFRKIFGTSERSAPSAAELAVLGGGPGSGAAPDFRVDSAYQGPEGLERVRLAQEEGRPYAMAFVDVRMPPGWDGIETTAQIWRQDPDIQIVLCTAYSDYSWSEMLAKLGRSDRLVILKKPFDTIEVLQLASALTEKWRLARQSRSLVEGLESRVAARTSELLQESEMKGAILESSLDCIITIDHQGRIVEFNPAAQATFGLTRDEARGQVMVDLIVPPRLRDAHRRGFAQYLATGKGPILGKRLELAAIRADGSEFPIELAITAIGAGAAPMFTGFLRDISARKQAEEKIRRLNRVHAVLSGINALIVRIRERRELFEEACRIAVQAGGLPFVSMTVVDEAQMRLRPAASAGDDGGFLATLQDRLSLRDDSPAGHGISARSVRQKRALVLNDVANAPEVKHKEALASRGIRSMAAFPLLVEGRAFGAIAMHSAELGFFDDEEMKLLKEVADNIAFALEHIEKEEKVRRLTRVSAVLSGINALIVRARDRDELFKGACAIAVGAGGFKLAWIAVVDRATMHLKPMAWEGAAQDYLEQMPLSLDPADQDQFGLAGHAVRDRKPVMVADMEHDPRVLLRSEARERDFHSLVMLPLVVADAVVGVLALYANEIDFFNQGEMKLLAELAGNIAFALEHMDKEEKVRRLTRVYAVLSGINTLIVRGHRRDELFRKACQIAVEEGGFRMAWIGIVDRAAQKIIPLASAGADAGFLVDPRQWLSLTDDSPGPSVMAVRDKRAMVVDEVDADPRMRGRRAHLDPGVRSLVILPLLVAGEPVAVFGLHALEAGYFDEQEMKLLHELAGDIAFAIDHAGKQERLEYLAYYDELTGLANRSLFLERVSQYMRSASRDGHQLALFLIDLERFKSINDSLGRAAGDALLKQVAAWLGHKVADVNLLSRIGADHFAVVLPKVSREGSVARLLDNAMDAFEEHPFQLDGGVFRIGTKSGVALFPGDGATADTLYKNAEAALKKAKASGDRYLFYKPQMTEAVAGKLTLENQLREALDKGEFVLHYQPKVNLASGKLTGAEALIRWNDPRTGLVPPGRFIPVLEETGMITEVGRWALRKALEDYLRWLDAGLPAVRVAVNVSPLQLRKRDFAAEVSQAIAIDARAPAGLELEITENLIMEDVKHSIATLRAIRDLGVTIAIDDFGTGFSSLSYLSKLPVDTLKIDRSFVIEMVAPEARSLVPAIIGLAHSLSLKVVAEGVETEDQSRLLRLLGCDEMQGYLFGKPAPAEVFEATYLRING